MSRRFKCLLCDKAYGSNLQLRRHVRKAHCSFDCFCGEWIGPGLLIFIGHLNAKGGLVFHMTEFLIGVERIDPGDRTFPF